MPEDQNKQLNFSFSCPYSQHNLLIFWSRTFSIKTKEGRMVNPLTCLFPVPAHTDCFRHYLDFDSTREQNNTKHRQLQLRNRKWRWLGHTIRKPFANVTRLGHAPLWRSRETGSKQHEDRLRLKHIKLDWAETICKELPRTGERDLWRRTYVPIEIHNSYVWRTLEKHLRRDSFID